MLTTLVHSDTTPTIYTEGVSQVMIGIPNSRILFHNRVQRQEADGKQEEIRHIALEVVMPTSAIVDMVSNLTAQLVQARDKYSEASSEWVKFTNTMLTTLESPKSQTAQPSGTQKSKK